MCDSENMMVLAIDGGGTRCRLAASSNGVDHIVEVGSANVSTDFDGSVAVIRHGLTQLSLKAGRSVDDLFALPAFIGLAGVTGPEMEQRLRNALPFLNAKISDDRPAALRGALGARDGVIAHCGTGSFYASQVKDRMTFAGGWGYVLGDEASAQWIGRQALRCAVETTDGRQPKTEFSQYLFDTYEDAAGIVRFANVARPSEFGQIAKGVTSFAADGDPLAQNIMKLGVQDIVRSLPKLGWSHGQAICLTGGIGPHYKDYLPIDMQTAVIDPLGAPLDGALDLARLLAKEPAHERG